MLIVELFYTNQHAAVTGTLRDKDGILHPGALRWNGYGLASALRSALAEARPLGAKRLQVYCNHAGLVQAFTRPVALALPEQRKAGRKSIPCGNDNQWDLARELAHYEWWRIAYKADLPSAKAIWKVTMEVSQKQLDEAYAAALAARKALLEPRYIETAKAELCCDGRLLRAFALAEKAMQDGDQKRVDTLKAAIPKLEADITAAQQKAESLTAEYFKLCEVAGVAPESLSVEICKCEYCIESRRSDALWAAESRLRRAVFALTEPGDCGIPDPLCLMSEKTETGDKAAWNLFAELVNAQANYKATCERLGRRPAWGYTLQAW